ncbi:MAG: YhcH/YjgK/YiaL family protein [Lentisphaeria bacterium]|nr:YhcH/YjgK/YiaL family protein [Lentisphaeria bacterium]
MIYDSLAKAAVYPLGPAFQKAVEFVRSLNVDSPNGRHEIDGSNIYANVMEYETEEAAPEKYEVHRAYADLQVLIAGHETIFVSMADNLTVHTPYNAEKDYAFLSADNRTAEVNLPLFPGTFVLLLPQDAHMGKGATRLGRCKLKKVVVKIALDLLKP